MFKLTEKHKQKTIYELQLHEMVYLEDLSCDVIRVHGGWVYKFYHGATFVPYTNPPVLDGQG